MTRRNGKGAKTVIKHYEQINFTPAIPIAVRGQHELLEAGLSEPVALFHWENRAIVAFHGQTPVGVIIWDLAAHRKEANIIIGYVVPEYRRAGIYKRLYAQLIKVAKEKGCNHIRGYTSVRNTALRSFAKTAGRSEMGVMINQEI
jgi:GNAT superfamily N-acetyltransferase